MGFFSLVRLVVLVVTLVFSVVVLGISADMLTMSADIGPELGVAMSVISIVSLLPMIVVDFLRRGAFTSWIIVEVCWLSVLWILWLSTGAYSVWAFGVIFGINSNCDYMDYYYDFIPLGDFADIFSKVCQEYKPLEAFSFVAAIILLGYVVVLIIFASISQSRGNKTWTSTVRDASFLVPSKAANEGHQMAQVAYPTHPTHTDAPSSPAIRMKVLPAQV